MNRFTNNIDTLITNAKYSKDKEYLKKIKRYIENDINPKELTEGVSNYYLYYLSETINKVINYHEKDIHYYVEIPNNLSFTRKIISEESAIIAAKHQIVDVQENIISIIGPSPYKNIIASDRQLTEVKGPFEEGLEISRSDWFKIITKYKYIYERMYNIYLNDGNNDYIEFTEFKEKLNNYFKEMVETYNHKNDNIINSVEFANNRVYLTKEKAKQGLPPFDILLESSKENKDVYSLKKTLDYIKKEM